MIGRADAESTNNTQCTGFTIISTTYVATNHKARSILQLRMQLLCLFQLNS